METAQIIALIVVMVILASGICILVVFSRSRKALSQLTQPQGRIDQPGSGEAVLRTIHCSGSIPQDGPNPEIVYWLAVETDGLIWPKEPVVQPGEVGRWLVDV